MIGGAGVLEVAPQESSVGWYILAGGGLYNVKVSVEESGVDVSDSESKFGFNAGVGLKFRVGGASLFVEGRYHGVKAHESNFTFLPLSFGISW
jgi:opacity protein-like surface antigen